MNNPPDDLLPLFLEEAGDRLERLHGLLEGLDRDPEAAAQVRREMHALKGASRMIGLPEMAELCHRAEDLLNPPEREAQPELMRLCNQLAELVGSLSEETAQAAARKPEKAGEGGQTIAERKKRPVRQEMRVASAVVDGLADRGARLRVLSVAAGGLADRVFKLATLAERGVGERTPRQVLATLATSLRQVALELEGGQRNLRRLTDSQLEALLRLQVQPLRPFLRGLDRHARDLAQSLGKLVEVEVAAGATQLDRRIVDALREAFLHLVRNAVDHGIETPEERARAGKPEIGSLRLEAFSEGDRVRLRMVDDGRGIDPDTAVRTAIRLGLITEESAAVLDPGEVLQLLFLPGFSTREEPSELSGRGVGLDAVAAAVRSVGGDLWLESKLGEGTVVTVEVPLARRGERVLVLQIGQHQLAMPASPVRAYRRVNAENLEEVDGRRVVRIGEQVVSACFLAEFLGDPEAEAGELVEMVIGGSVLGVVADAVLGEEEVIVRPLPAAAGAPRVVEGIALLASGRPVAVLSLGRLGPLEETEGVAPPVGVPRARPVRVLLVDDSAVTREMVRQLLEDGGFVVTGVATAEDALHTLEEHEFDCLVTDIEMPGMDGLTLTRMLRENPRLSDLPIVVISTRDRPADRLAGLEAGADAYLTKQGLDARELVGLVQRVGGGR